MKNTGFRLTIVAMVTACAIISCEKVAPEPEGPEDKPNVEQPEEKPDAGYPEAKNANTYVINGTEYAFQSSVLMAYGENLTVAASPAAGHTDVTEMMEPGNEYFFAGLNPLLIGRTTDLMTETSLFTIISSLADATIQGITPENVDSEISKGTCFAQYEDGTLTLKAGLVLTDGTTLAVNILAKAAEDEEIVINENEYAKGDALKPLRAAFYMKEDELTYLYFTPGAISYFEELEIATSFMSLVVSDNLINGKKIELSDITANQFFIFGYIDNATGEKVVVTNETLDIAEGILCIKNPEEGIYTVTFEFIIEDEVYYVYYDGECTSASIEAPIVEIESHFVCGDEKASIMDAELEKGEELWTLSLILDNAKRVTITMPANFWSFEVVGFSQNINISVSYDGTTWSKANKNSGTITPSLDEEAGTIEIQFTNYNNCEFYYSGPYKVIQ